MAYDTQPRAGGFIDGRSGARSLHITLFHHGREQIAEYHVFEIISPLQLISPLQIISPLQL
jgi:hypothetical protein